VKSEGEKGQKKSRLLDVWVFKYGTEKENEDPIAKLPRDP
jgi:hypothetical protein